MKSFRARFSWIEPAWASVVYSSRVWLAIGICVAVVGCGKDGAKREQPKIVIVYTALDQQFSAPIFKEFSRQTGIDVRAKYDTESQKTVGLTQDILAERNRPRCDLFWNNEILNTLRLERAGLLRPAEVSTAEDFPTEMRSADETWYGFAARARVLIVNTNQVSEDRRPKSVLDLADLQWRDRVGMAKPLFGTTATHAACLFAAWGDERAKEFFRNVKDNARILAGNRQVAEAVSAGVIAFGLTDTDDAIIEIEKGMPVAIVYPDQDEGELGALFIPNTLALIAGSAHQESAERLLEYLLSPEVERRLAEGPSAQIPLRPGVPASSRVKTPGQVRAMDVDWSRAAEKWDTAAEFLKQEFAAAN